MAKFLFFGTMYYLCKNSSTGRYYLRRQSRTHVDNPSQAQLAQRAAFKVRTYYVSAWLRANRKSETNPKGTADYQRAQKLKQRLHFTSVTQVIHHYMNAYGKVILP